MTDNEAKKIQSMAVHSFIDEYVEQEYINDDNAITIFKKAANKMPAMKEFVIVRGMGELFNEFGLPEGVGPMELFEELTYDMEKFIYYNGLHNYDFEGPPDYLHELKGFEVPRKVAVWGWRPTKLECPSYPVMFE